ncbi:TIR domain-containing protein [Sorangium sp. So ce542]|uniref:TIR domain-containing protein n=1 Tax=Sorangium sp. So ce542 TaxID=3133316 RepID=UPI003F6491BB
MARNVFYSFHYVPDNWRVSQVRNMGVVDGNQQARDNDWEAIVRGGRAAIKRWIDAQMYGKSCVVVLIGENTAGRPWINYEIKKGWNDGKGVLGIHIHGLKDRDGDTAGKGDNPFDDIYVDSTPLSDIVPTYDPGGWLSDSRDVYAEIKENLADWIEEAIEIRDQY